MLRDLGISGGTFILCAIALYFIVKWAVKNAIIEAHSAITGEKTADELEVEAMMAEDNRRREEAREARKAKKAGTV